METKNQQKHQREQGAWERVLSMKRWQMITVIAIVALMCVGSGFVAALLTRGGAKDVGARMMPPPPIVRVVKKSLPRPKKLRPRPQPRPTLAQIRARRKKMREQLFSGEFSLSRFPRRYRKLVAYKITEFTDVCEADERCIKDQLEQAMRRAGPYLKQIKTMLRKADVPPILLYLTFAESMWQVDIRSRAGAYGLCQFMPNTAKWLGFLLHGEFSYFRTNTQRVLQKNDKGQLVFVNKSTISEYDDVFLYDQRRDMFYAINKKIEYLKALKERYKGDSWILAAFRYNFGPGNVGRIMRRVRAYFNDLPRRRRTHTRLIQMFLRANGNQENYHYVANIMAFAHILSGLEAAHPEWVVPKPLTAVPYVVPVQHKQVSLRRGETVSRIASRHQVTVRAVLKASQLSVRRASRLQVGATIKVPVPKRLFLTPRMIRKALGVGMEFYKWNPGIHDPRKKISEVDVRYRFLYKVKPGTQQTLASIAKRFAHRRVSVRQLQGENSGEALFGDDDIDMDKKSVRRRLLMPGAIVRVAGWMKVSNDEDKSGQASATQQEQVEKTMPPLPAGWVLYVPPRLSKKLNTFLKAHVASYGTLL